MLGRLIGRDNLEVWKGSSVSPHGAETLLGNEQKKMVTTLQVLSNRIAADFRVYVIVAILYS